MSVCIYCLEEKDVFDRDHVMPECFGGFENNPVLTNIVCKECNEYFGKNIELFLGRDTLEGMERFKHNIKSEGKMKRQRVKLKIDFGPMKGMIVEAKPSDGGLKEIDIDPVMQLGFFNQITQQYDYFEPGDVPPASELTRMGYDIKGSKIEFMAKNDEGIKYLLEVLEKQGMQVKIEGGDTREFPDEVKNRGRVLVAGEIRVDAVIFRGMGKIAFNYLAFTAGKDFVLDKSFNEIRSFIRYGIGGSRELFTVNNKPILLDERRFGIKQTDGHLVLVEWKGRGVIARVSIFNLSTYHFRLCKYFGGVYRPIDSGHHFDLESRKISALGKLPKGFFVPGSR